MLGRGHLHERVPVVGREDRGSLLGRLGIGRGEPQVVARGGRRGLRVGEAVAAHPDFVARPGQLRQNEAPFVVRHHDLREGRAEVVRLGDHPYARLRTLSPFDHPADDAGIGGVTDADGDPVAVTIDSIFQDEPVDAHGNGDGNTCPDGQGVGTGSASVRAERAGGGDGRVYHIGFTATDASGETCQGTVAVCVPHDQGNGNECIDQGGLFDSTVCP